MKWMQWIADWFGGTTKSLSSLGVGLRSALSGNAPGGWASDHREETAHNTGFNYIAIHAIASQVAGATVTVFADGDQQAQRQSRRKSLAARTGSFSHWKSTYGADDRETDPLPASHPLVRLLRRPNAYESGANFRYRQAQQMRLTGTCLIWNVPSVSGRTCERYVIPTAMATPVVPTSQLPRGGWRINPVASRYTSIVDDGYVDCPSWYRILGQIIDARQVQVIRLPHALYLDDGQSPLSAGAKWVDAGEAVDEARYHQLKNGVDPSVVWNLPPDVSPDQDEIDRVQAKISAKYGGPENVGRVMVAQSGTSITPLSTSPKDMCYTDGFQDFKAAVLALHQTPPVAVGLQEPGAYAAYNASLKAWRHAAIQPLCDMLAESDTEHLAPQFGDGLTIDIESATVDDADLIEQQLQNDLAARVRTKNEWRAVRGMPRLPGTQGDELVGTDNPAATDKSTPFGGAVNGPELTPGHGQSKAFMDQFDKPRNEQDEGGPESAGQPPDMAIGQQSRENRASLPPGHRTTSVEESHRKESGNDPLTDDGRVGLIVDIIYRLFGSSATSLLDLPAKDVGAHAKSYDPNEARDAQGRWTGGGSHQAIARARDIVSRILSGDRDGVSVDEVARHLSVLSKPQLQLLHREHGIETPHDHRAHLTRSVMARLPHFPEADPEAFPAASRSDNVVTYVQHPDEIAQRIGLPSKSEHLETRLGKLVGAQPGARVYAFPESRIPWNRRIEIFVDHPDYRAKRIVDPVKKIIHNLILDISPARQQQGIAARMLSDQTQTAAEHGYRSLHAHASGAGSEITSIEDERLPHEPRANGYYAWARLGFQGKIGPLMRQRKQSRNPELRAIAADFDATFPGVTNVSQMMRTKSGREWWQKYGGAFEGTFDLKPDSTSRQVLEKYIAAKKSPPKRKSLVAATDDPSRGDDGLLHETVADVHGDSGDQPGQSWFDQQLQDEERPDGFSSTDEEVLDQIWDELDREPGPEGTGEVDS
jgi:hypothetical protein